MAKLKLAIDLGTHSTKLLVQKKRYRSMILIGAQRIRTPSDSIQEGEIIDADSLSKMLKELLRPYPKRADVILTLSIPSVIHRQITFPRVKRSQVKDLVYLQLERMLSEQLKNYIFQYKLGEDVVEEGENKASAIVFAIPRKIVDGLVSLCEKTGMDPYVLDVYPNIIPKLIDRRILVPDPAGNIRNLALVDLGYSNTSVHIMEEQGLSFTRVITMGTRLIDEAIREQYRISEQEAERIKVLHTNFFTGSENESTVSKIAENSLRPLIMEIQRILRYINLRKKGTEIRHAYIYGGGAHLKNIDKFLEESLNIHVSIIKDLEKIAFKQGLQELSKTDYLNCAGALERAYTV